MARSMDPGDTEGAEGAGDDPEMADRNVGSFDEIGRGGHIRGFPESTRILQFDILTKGPS